MNRIYRIIGGVNLYKRINDAWPVALIRDNEIALFLGSSVFYDNRVYAIWMNQRGKVGISQWIPTKYPRSYLPIE